MSDLLQLKSLPKILCAGSSWLGPNPETTVDKNELFIIKSWKRKIQGKVLKVFNPITKAKKELVEGCEGVHAQCLI